MKFSKDVSAVVATIDRPSLGLTIETLNDQTLRPARVIIVHDDMRLGAPVMRNRGAAQCTTEWIVFSDDDIEWEPTALERMYESLGDSDFAYGSYMKGNRVYCDRQFDPEYLRKRNYISTMSMVRADAFPGFDETLRRLQDWDLWLTMMERGSLGAYCGSLIFKTHENGGISSGDDWREAERAVKAKHGL